MIYIFRARDPEGHFTLDNGKTAKHNETIDLDSSDTKRVLISQMIEAFEKKDSNADRLELVDNSKKPEQSKKNKKRNKK